MRQVKLKALKGRDKDSFLKSAVTPTTMKPIKIALILLLLIFAGLQYRLWFADDGLLKVINSKRTISELQAKNDEITKHNTYLASEITALKKGGAAIENRARGDLGMVKKGEIFYQVVRTDS
ncbi:MAG: Septum formation initiator [uncultured bacterium]|nr:MAG: Septum formation initiator [uncultured bacterium]